MTQVSESDYRIAQRGDEKVRQEFMNEVDLEESKEFFKRVIYQSEQVETRALAHLASFYIHETDNSLIFKLKNEKSDLIAYPNAFEMSYPLFLSVCIDHEGQHGRQCILNPRGYEWTQNKIIQMVAYEKDPKYFMELIEASALANQMLNAERRKLPEIETGIQNAKFLECLLTLQDCSKNFTMPRNLLADLKIVSCNSHADEFTEYFLKNNPDLNKFLSS
jgi:hypothetical protein